MSKSPYNHKPIFILAVLVLSVGCVVTAFGQPTSKGTVAAMHQQTEYFGQLDKNLVPDTDKFRVGAIPAASAAEVNKVGIALRIGETASIGKIIGPRFEDLLVALVASKDKSHTFFADINQNGNFSADERHDLLPIKHDTSERYDGEVLVQFPIDSGIYKNYPLLIRIFKTSNDREAQSGARTILHSPVYAQGNVNIEGLKVRVKYGFDRSTGQAVFMQGELGIDGNEDGTIESGDFSPETAFAEKEPVVFRVGTSFVSTKSIDMKTGKITLTGHPREQYRRLELRLGAELPDFTYRDFSGVDRKLSDFRGKYLLLVFWGTWCTPCRTDVPYLKAAYSKYKSSGFEILGMDKDDTVEKAKTFVAEHGIRWTQASAESINELINVRLRVYSFPAEILIDPRGKIISLGGKDQMPLRAEKLSDTLQKLLPPNE